MRNTMFLAAGQVATGWTWYNAMSGKLATIGGDAVIWIPILIQVLSFLSTLLKNHKEKGGRPEPAK